MDVLDDDCERPLPREPLECFPDRPGDLLRRPRLQDRLELVLGTALAKDLRERPVGDALPVRKAAPGDDRRAAGDRRDELARETRLADARRPEHRDKPAARARRSHRRRPLPRRKLLPAPDERSVVAPFEGGSALDHVDEAVRGNRVGLPLERERLDRLDLDRSARQAAASARRAGSRRAGGLLEPGGDVDRVARREALLASR